MEDSRAHTGVNVRVVLSLGAEGPTVIALSSHPHPVLIYQSAGAHREDRQVHFLPGFVPTQQRNAAEASPTPTGMM